MTPQELSRDSPAQYFDKSCMQFCEALSYKAGLITYQFCEENELQQSDQTSTQNNI